MSNCCQARNAPPSRSAVSESAVTPAQRASRTASDGEARAVALDSGLFSHSGSGLAFLPILWLYDNKMIKARPIAAHGVIPGAGAARLRQRRLTRLQGLTVPPDALPGSLALTYTRCGKPNCRCARGGADPGHPGWQLTYRVAGRKRVERIPAAWVEEVRRRVEAGRAFHEAVAEVFALNAELLVLERRQRGKPARRRSGARGR